MTIFTRMANPYSYPGGPNATDVASLYAPGELGQGFNDQSTGRSHVLVKLDSGATSANAVGAPAAGQLAFWKDRTNFIVTNDKRQAGDSDSTNGAVNNIAGVFTNAPTPGNYTCIVIAGNSVNVASSGITTSIGFQTIADTTASTSRAVALATATTAPTSQVIGRISGATSGGLTPVDVRIGFLS